MVQQAIECSIWCDTVAKFRQFLWKRIGTVIPIRKPLHSINIWIICMLGCETLLLGKWVKTFWRNRIRSTSDSYFYHEERDKKFLRNRDNYSPTYTESHSRKPYSQCFNFFECGKFYCYCIVPAVRAVSSITDMIVILKMWSAKPKMSNIPQAFALYSYIKASAVLAMSQAVNCWPVITEARIQPHALPCGSWDVKVALAHVSLWVFMFHLSVSSHHCNLLTLWPIADAI
jgi:hypothetical protein